MTRCIVIRNPTSRGRLSAARLEAALDVARGAGWDVRWSDTTHEGHGIEIARGAAREGVDVVVVNGGDGTINEAVNGIAGTDVALAVLPAGTANVWAKEAHVSKDPLAAMRDIVAGVRRRIDLGRADTRYFLLMAGIGLDAAVVPHVSSAMKQRLGAAAYIMAGVVTALRTKPWHVTMRVDGAPAEASVYWMLIGNTRSYGGLTDIMYRAEADDGWLDVGVMHRGGAFHLLADGARLLFHRHDRSPNVDYVRARSVEIDTPGLPVQLDGESAGETPMRFEVAPLALTVIVPRGLSTPLFRGAPDGGDAPAAM